MLLAEAVIIGDIPESYYNFDSLDQDMALQVLE